MFKNQDVLKMQGYKEEEDYLVLMNGSMCIDVYHIGKWPRMFYSCHYRNGQSIHFRYRNLKVTIPNPISFLKFRFGDLFTELKYAVKSYFTAKSGFLQMESKYWDGDTWMWEYCEPGENDPYYVCARFANGRHIPLPILANWYEDSNKWQKFAIRLAGGAPAAVEEAELYSYQKE